MAEPGSHPTDDGAVSTWMLVLAGGLLLLVATFIGVAYMTGMPGFRTTQTAVAVAGGSAPEHLYLSIVTNEGLGPAYIPSSFSIPAGTPVIITVTNFDSNTPLPPAYANHVRVSGTVGNVGRVQPLSASQPILGGRKVSTIHQLSAGDVSHTFTIPSLGINVPMQGRSRTTFTVLVKKAGSYRWQCFDPCGSGPSGFGGVMAEPGYMFGTLNVTA
jgi:hypothetical protein